MPVSVLKRYFRMASYSLSKPRWSSTDSEMPILDDFAKIVRRSQVTASWSHASDTM